MPLNISNEQMITLHVIDYMNQAVRKLCAYEQPPVQSHQRQKLMPVYPMSIST
jgi:hypothetical protein